MNPNWNQPTSDDQYDVSLIVQDDLPEADSMKEIFKKASEMTGEEFTGQLDYYAKAWLPARDVVKAALDKRTEVDPSGAIVVFHQVSYLPLVILILIADHLVMSLERPLVRD